MMAFTAVQNIALILIIFAIIKILVLLVKPQAWMNFAKWIYSKPQIDRWVGLILAGIVFYYLYGAGITIIEILAVTAFVALLLMIALAGEVDSLIKKYQVMIKRGNLWKNYWLYTLLWIVLLIWGLNEIFSFF